MLCPGNTQKSSEYIKNDFFIHHRYSTLRAVTLTPCCVTSSNLKINMRKTRWETMRKPNKHLMNKATTCTSASWLAIHKQFMGGDWAGVCYGVDTCDYMGGAWLLSTPGVRDSLPLFSPKMEPFSFAVGSGWGVCMRREDAWRREISSGRKEWHFQLELNFDAIKPASKYNIICRYI